MRKGVTIIETAVVGVIAVVAGSITIGGVSSMSSKAQTAKCLNNLQRTMTALQLYTTENDGILPGPIHPAAARWNPTAIAPREQRKSIAWYMRPYFDEYGQDLSDPDNPNPVVDKLLTCPSFLAKKRNYLMGEYSYVMNTFGPIMNTSEPEWYHTDPPRYFGVWYYGDPYPTDSDYVLYFYQQRSWRPKTLESIPNSSSEWAIGDVWERKIRTGAARPGESPDREFLGSYPTGAISPSGVSSVTTPCAPVHEAPFVEYSGLARGDTLFYPAIDFTGKTNHGYFDGHVASFSGNWRMLGDGGTVNPYWVEYGGTHDTWNPAEYE